MDAKKSKLIVFDLDETLIHASKEKLGIKEDFKYEEYYVYKRPFLDEFIKSISEYCSLAIWSSADDEYVKQIVKGITIDIVQWKFVWSRKDCWVKIIKRQSEEMPELFKKEQRFIKPLEKIRKKNFKMKNLLIVDDTKEKVEDNSDNYI